MYNKLYIFNAYNLMAEFWPMCATMKWLYHSQEMNMFIISRSLLMPCGIHPFLSTPPNPIPRQLLICFLSLLISLPFLEFYIHGIILHFVSGFFYSVILRFIYVAVSFNSTFFIAEQYSIMCLYLNLLMYSSVGECLGSFWCFAITNKLLWTLMYKSLCG